MERAMSELALNFCKEKNLVVHLILYGRDPEIFYSVPQNLIIHRPRKAFNNRFRLIYTLGRMLFLRRSVKLIGPDAVLSFGEYWNSFVLLALLVTKYPIFISDRCSPTKTFGTFHQVLRKWLYPKSQGVIAQTEIAKQMYISGLRYNKIGVIGNPIRQSKTFGNTNRENIVLTVGRLIESKHHDKLIELFSEIPVNNWKLVIVGDDAIKQKNMDRLRELIERLNMGGKIILTGNIQDVEFYYQKSKIFVFTSSSEGFPNVIGEALSAGLPVISFDCVAGPSELIQNEENGYLIPLFDYKSFKIALHNLMIDSKLREKMSLKAPPSIARFSSETISKTYLEFIFS